MGMFYAFLASLFIVVVSFSIFLMSQKSKRDEDPKLPPGQKGWPVVGESFEFLATGRKGQPEKFILDRMAKFSTQVFRTSLMLQDVVVFCGSASNKFLLSNENKVTQRWFPANFNKIFSNLNQPWHIEAINMRNVVHTFFKPENVHRFVPIMDTVIRKHFENGWEGKNQVVTLKLTKNFTFSLACKIFLSIDDPKRVKYLFGPLESINAGIFSIPIDLPGTAFRKGINSAKFIRKELVAIIRQRKIDLTNGEGSPTQDVLSNMILYTDKDGKFMEEHGIADQILAVLIAAHDATSSICASIVYFLADLPEIYERVYKEQTEIAQDKAAGELLNWDDLSKMKYSWNVACEVLRLASPAQGGFREVITEFTYNGYSIPQGWKLYWNVNSTHLNPQFFPEPQKFDPSRFDGTGPAPYTFIPFGGGAHICPAKVYSRMKILMFMHHLVTKFKWEKIIPNEKLIVNPIPMPVKGLPIRLYPHPKTLKVY